MPFASTILEQKNKSCSIFFKLNSQPDSAIVPLVCQVSCCSASYSDVNLCQVPQQIAVVRVSFFFLLLKKSCKEKTCNVIHFRKCFISLPCTLVRKTVFKKQTWKWRVVKMSSVVFNHMMRSVSLFIANLLRDMWWLIYCQTMNVKPMCLLSELELVIVEKNDAFLHYTICVMEINNYKLLRLELWSSGFS